MKKTFILILLLFMNHNIHAQGKNNFVLRIGNSSPTFYSGELFKEKEKKPYITPSFFYEGNYILSDSFDFGLAITYSNINKNELLEKNFTNYKPEIDLTDKYAFSYGPSFKYNFNFNRITPHIGFSYLYSQSNVKYYTIGLKLTDGVPDADGKLDPDNKAYFKYKRRSHTINFNFGIDCHLYKNLYLYGAYSFGIRYQKISQFDLSKIAPDYSYQVAEDYDQSYIIGYIHTLKIGIQMYFSL